MLNSKQQRGDTLIEVILACAIFAMVTVSAFAIMQRASANAYDAMERSQVRALLNGQADLLHYLRDAYVQTLTTGGVVTAGQASVWNTIVNTPTYNSTAPNVNGCLPTTVPNNFFYIARNGTTNYQLKAGPTNIVPASGMPQAGQGMWIQRVDSPTNSANKKYKDFYIMACWQSTTNNTQNMSTIVRMYDTN